MKMGVAHFLSHTYETQEICCFLADVQIILVALFEFFDLYYCLKVAKNADAFLSRCSELFELHHSAQYDQTLTQRTLESEGVIT